MITFMATSHKISKILHRLMDEHRLSQAELSRRTGVQQSTLSRLLNPNRPNAIAEPTDRQLRPLADYFGITTDQLRGYQPITGSGKTELESVGKADRCPFISWEQARSWAEHANEIMNSISDWLPCPLPHSDRTYVLRVTGESMHNPHGDLNFKGGNLIYVDPKRKPESGNLVVAHLKDKNEVTFRQLIQESGNLYLKALNPAWPEGIIKTNGDAEILGVVIGKLEALI